MNQMNKRYQETHFVAQQAAEWLATLETADSRTRTEFVRWLKESPLHVREMLLALEVTKHLSGIDRERRIDLEALIARASQTVDLPSAARRRASDLPSSTNRNARASRWAALAASVLLLAGALWALQLAPVMDLWNRHDYRTATGELRTITLDDGSLVHLDAHSRVRVRYSSESRDIDLVEGTALFNVAHAPARPFRVHVDDAVVQAVGTQFEVNRRADRVIVSVLEGKVQVNAAPVTEISLATIERLPEPVLLAAGESTRIAAEGQISKPQPVNVSEVGAWRQRRLVFQMSTLAEIAAEFARYTRTPTIRIDGEALREQRFSAIFDADRPQSLVRYLERDPSLIIEDRGEEIVVRAREGGSL